MDSVLDHLEPLGREVNPQVAAALGLCCGGIGLGLYFWSFIDALVPLILAILMIVLFAWFAPLGVLGGALVAAVYGYMRAVNSNARLRS